MKHPKDMPARQRTQTGLMIDAFRMVERDLHYRLLELRTIPKGWHDIHENRRERHPKRTRVTANFDADVVRFFKGLGPGYQWRMNEVLRAYMHGRLAKIIEGPDTTDYFLHPERIPEDPERVGWGDSDRELNASREAWQKADAEREAALEEYRALMAEEPRETEEEAAARRLEGKKKYGGDFGEGYVGVFDD